MSYTPITAGTQDWDVPVNAAFTDQDARITANGSSITTLQTTTSTHTSQISDLQGATDALDWQADEMGLLGWAFDPAVSSQGSNTLLVSGVISYIKIPLRKAATISNAVILITSVGATLTAGQNLVGLFDSTGNRVAITADQATAWVSGGVGTKTIPFTTPFVATPGFYYLGVMSNGTTPISIFRGNTGSTSVINMGGSARYVESAGGQTALPASFTPGSSTSSTVARWGGIS